MKQFEHFIKWGGWIIAVVVGTVSTLNYLNAPSKKNTTDISELQTKFAVMQQEHDTYRILVSDGLKKIDRVSDDVAWIRGALANIGIKAPSIINNSQAIK